MNKQQRKQIYNIAATFNEWEDADALLVVVNDILDWKYISTTLDTAKSVLESIRDEEQAKYDSMPESLQGGSKGEEMQEGIDNLESAIDALDTAVSEADDTSATDEDRAEAVASAVADAVGYLDNF